MTVTPDKSATMELATDAGLVLEGASPSPVIITEREVLLSTAAAAVPLEQPKTAHRFTDATHVLSTALRGMFLTSTADARPARRHYPSRLEFLEHAAMSREMDRL